MTTRTLVFKRFTQQTPNKILAILTIRQVYGYSLKEAVDFLAWLWRDQPLQIEHDYLEHFLSKMAEAGYEFVLAEPTGASEASEGTPENV